MEYVSSSKTNYVKHTEKTFYLYVNINYITINVRKV